MRVVMIRSQKCSKEKRGLMKKFHFQGVHSNGHGNIFNGFRLNQTFNQSSRRVWDEKKILRKIPASNLNQIVV